MKNSITQARKAGIALAIALPFAATACGGGGGGGDTIVIGTKFDQPGLGLKNPDGSRERWGAGRSNGLHE